MNDIKVILDLWNWYTRGIVVAKEDGKNILLAKEQVKTKWMRKGKILDIDEFIFSISSILDSFVKKLGENFMDEVYVSISHPHMQIRRVADQKRILTQAIQSDDIQHLSNVVQESWAQPNYEIIKIIPVQWIVDDELKLKDPLGMEGRKLELIADVFMIPKNFYNTLLECFEKLQVWVADISLNILWSSEVTLDVDAKDLWTLLIDIGAHQTSYVVYEEGYPLLYGVLPIGWEEVTKDISICLQMDINEAEKIKREMWSVSLSPQHKEESQIDTTLLIDVITARYEQIFNKINDELITSGKDGKLPGGVVLLGWWSMIADLDVLSKDVFKLASFYWQDKYLHLGQLANDLQFLNLVGAYQWFEKYGETSTGWFKMSFDFGGIFKKITKLFKDMF